MLARGLAEGLNAIHAAGVVHRDLKPANVLLAEDGPRLIDFGISRAVEASALTHTGLVVGSPGFMSPEQAEGREVGPPSDVFSLGAVLAFAATGQGPFGSGSTPALVYRVVYCGPQLDLVPAEVRQLIDRCLAKDPARRPTADDLLSGAAPPAAGWLPEPVTRSLAAAPATTTAAAPLGAPAPVPPVPGPPPSPPPPFFFFFFSGGSRRPVTACAAARRLAAADRNTGPVRAARSRHHGRRHDDRQLGTGARGSVRTADHASPDTRRPARPPPQPRPQPRPRRIPRPHRRRRPRPRRLHTATEHAARNHHPAAAEFQRAAEPNDVPEPGNFVVRLIPGPTTATPAAQLRGY